MPHFIIECNSDTLKVIQGSTLVQEVFDIALNSGLFYKSDIKSRLRVYNESIVAGENHDFIHVWGHIREGRTEEQRRKLSEEIAYRIKELYQDAFLVSCNIYELDEASYIKIQL